MIKYGSQLYTFRKEINDMNDLKKVMRFLSGEGGTAYSGGTNGKKVEDVVWVVEGPYEGSGGNVVGPGIDP